MLKHSIITYEHKAVGNKFAFDEASKCTDNVHLMQKVDAQKLHFCYETGNSCEYFVSIQYQKYRWLALAKRKDKII